MTNRYAERREYQAAYRLANRDRIRAKQRAYRAANPDGVRARATFNAHGLWPEQLAEIWHAQDCKCYLCGEPLPLDQMVIEHDHRHCGPSRSCVICRRGLAHNACNRSIGHAGDDPGKLRRMADALEAANAEVDRRMACGQADLFELDRNHTPKRTR